MSVAMAMEFPDGSAPFTAEDLEAMPDDSRRYEIVDGMLHVSAAPGRLHQRACRRITRLLEDACPRNMEVIQAPFSVRVAPDTVMEPDVLVALDSDLTDRDLPVAPLLAVEVLSHSTRFYDTHVKRERFERAGTPDFWVVDPVAGADEARLIAWSLGDDGRYRQVADVKGGDPYHATHPFPVTVTPADLLR
jgi:Uma2 family endonuclease